MEDRNKYFSDDRIFLIQKVNAFSKLSLFNCNDNDLNEYFHVDAELHKKELLTQTYEFTTNELENEIIGLVDLSNDSVDKRKFPSGVKPAFMELKNYSTYPAVKITRLGIDIEYQGNNAGSIFLNMIKKMFLKDNRTGCRFITIDAYNNERTLRFYEKNDFTFFSDKDKNKKTRSMYFDLKRYILK